jgi:hypothetical protein
VKSHKELNTKKNRKRLWIALAALAALQVYFVRELIAALVLFSILFVVVAAVALGVYLFDRASQRTMDWAEPQTVKAAELAKKALEQAEKVSKKQLHRLRSATVR